MLIIMNVFYNLSYCNSNLKLLNFLSLLFSKTKYFYILHVSCEAQLHSDDNENRIDTKITVFGMLHCVLCYKLTSVSGALSASIIMAVSKSRAKSELNTGANRRRLKPRRPTSDRRKDDGLT